MSYSLCGLPGMWSTHCHIDLVQSNWWMALGSFFPVLMWNMGYHRWYIRLPQVLWCHSGVVPRFQDIRRPISHQWTPVVVEQVSSSADLLNDQHWTADSRQYLDQHFLSYGTWLVCWQVCGEVAEEALYLNWWHIQELRFWCCTWWQGSQAVLIVSIKCMVNNRAVEVQFRFRFRFRRLVTLKNWFEPSLNLNWTYVTIEEAPTSFSPFSLVNCTLLSHFSFNDFVTVAFPDLAGDLDTQI